jgi:hypothetical protein
MIEEQLTAGVGVSMITGSTRITGDVGVVVPEAQALRIKIPAVKNNIKKIRFMGVSLVLERLLRCEEQERSSQHLHRTQVQV